MLQNCGVFSIIRNEAQADWNPCKTGVFQSVFFRVKTVEKALKICYYSLTFAGKVG